MSSIVRYIVHDGSRVRLRHPEKPLEENLYHCLEELEMVEGRLEWLLWEILWLTDFEPPSDAFEIRDGEREIFAHLKTQYEEYQAARPSILQRVIERVRQYVTKGEEP